MPIRNNRGRMWFAYTVLPIVCTSASVLGPLALQLGLTLDKNWEKKCILYSLSFLLVISWLGLLVSFLKLRWGGKCIFQQTNSSVASCTGFLCWLLPLLSCKWRKKNPLAPWREILASVQQVSLQAMAHMHSQSHLSTAGGHCVQWVGWGKQVNMGKGTAGLRHKPALYKRNQKSKGK